MVAGRRTESSTFFFPRCRMPPRGWTAPGPRLDRADENAVPAAVRPALGLCRNGELPPTRGVGRSSGIVRRLRFPLISSFCLFLSLQFLSGLEGLQKWDAPRGLMEGTSVCTGANSMAPFLPNSIERRILPLQEARGAGGQWQVRTCRETVFLRFSSSQPGQLPKKSLPRNLFAALPTHDSHQPKTSAKVLFCVPAVAAGGWFMVSANSAGMPHPSQPRQRYRVPLACRPLTTGGGLAACAVDAGGSS